MTDRATAADDERGGDANGLIEGESSAVEASGRPYLLGAGGTVTLFAAAAGYVVAANNEVDAVTVFDLVTLPGSPAAMAVYGGVLSALILSALFGLVAVASRFDDDAVN
ncbi:DUF7520 family protein [Halobaculum gomorrense]|uniref:Cox cluster protein n=1 Tax=Halobaculum gomorrense TaxID=43928 RepID=A0A1M5UMD6_9EURY|nr:hypothetical protein [Halobaculum gomorrense]SHH64174.1 hypothetical protein SAMN05443636_3072 [Halobaculum gomorrense]